MTTSGLYATVASIGDDTVDLEVAPGVTVRWAKAAVAEMRPRRRPMPAAPRDSEPDAV